MVALPEATDWCGILLRMEWSIAAVLICPPESSTSS
jgi:hypothetical protein